MPQSNGQKRSKGEGDAVSKLVEKGKSAFSGPEIKGKKLGVIGLGAIGVLVANAAHSLGMEVTVTILFFLLMRHGAFPRRKARRYP